MPHTPLSSRVVREDRGGPYKDGFYQIGTDTKFPVFYVEGPINGLYREEQE
jgi:hypothetical protein